ncbi:MAG: hypothetical protein ACM3O3_12990 [Syntrophothermus sp.]
MLNNSKYVKVEFYDDIKNEFYIGFVYYEGKFYTTFNRKLRMYIKILFSEFTVIDESNFNKLLNMDCKEITFTEFLEVGAE